MNRNLEVSVARQQDQICSLLIDVRSLDGMPVAKANSFELTLEKVMLQGICPVAPNIPLFAATSAPLLQLEKKAETNNAYIGDIIRYTLILTNQNPQFSVDNIWIEDSLPPGMSYIPGSTLLDGNAYNDPQEDDKKTLSWFISGILPEERLQLSYTLRVEPDAYKGDGLNTAQASGQSLNEIITSNQAKFKLRIREGVFSSKGIVIGKVFIDKDGSGLQNFEEPGIAGIHLYLESGVRIITDEYGKFSIFGLAPGTHVLRLDETTLPSFIKRASENSRANSKVFAQFLDIKAGELYQVDFPLISQKNYLPLISPEKDLTKLAHDSLNEKSISKRTTNLNNCTLEEEILQMSPEPSFLYPEDNQIMKMGHINVRVKFPLGAKITLEVNGKIISQEKIGTKTTSSVNQVTIYEFISLKLNPGENILRMQVKDQFGNLRSNAEIKLYRIGPPRSIHLTSENKEIPADGITKTLICVKLQDRKDYLIPGPYILTVESSAGQIEEKDIDLWTSGIQISYQNAQASFHLISARKTGPATITVHCEGISQSKKIHFTPYIRPPLLTGVAELTLGYGNTKGDYLAAWHQLPEKEGLFHKERISFFFKGKWQEDKVLTLSYNSDNSSEKGLFETLDSSDKQEGYPVYGDSSSIEYEAQSKTNFYAKLEHKKYYLMWGDYRIDNSQMRLANYRRNFNGFKALGKNGAYQGNLFVSHTSYTPQHDEIPGQGISGYYYLQYTPIIPGTEQIYQEVKDKENLDNILSKKRLHNGKDYEINYDIGSLMFKQPISYEDADGNPVFIVVDYQTEEGKEKKWIVGLRGEGQLTDNIKLQFEAIKEEKTETDFLMLGSMAHLSLNARTNLKLEVARTSHLSKINGTQKSGEAWRIELDQKLTKKISLKGHYQDVNQNFDNPQAQGAVAGTAQYGLMATAELTPSLKTALNHLYQEKKDGGGEYQRSKFSLLYKAKLTSWELSLISQRSETGYLPPNLTKESLLSQSNLSELTSAQLKIKAKLSRQNSLLVQYEQALNGPHLSYITAGLDHQLNDVTVGYLKLKRSIFQNEIEVRLIAGWKSKLTQNISFYQEYEIKGGISGENNQHKIGLNSKFTIKPV